MSKNTFAGYQEAKQSGREAIMDEFLAYLKSTRIRAAHATALADLVARHISAVEGKPCSTSTLMRNLRYKSKILTHQAVEQAPGAKALDKRSVKDPTAQALMTTSELEASNLRRELARLQIYTATLEEEVDKLRNERAPALLALGADDSGKGAARVEDVEFDFIRTCQALRAVVSHFNILMQLDTSERRILDASKRRDNVIANKETAGPFFDWLSRMPGALK